MINILAIIGKAGSGKNTILNYFLEDQLAKDDRCHIIVPFTTRPARPGELDGRDYHFFQEGEVAPLIEAGEVAQCVYFREWLYGYLWDELQEGVLNIGVFNPDAVFDLLDYDSINMTVVYITAPGKDRLLRQLNREDDPDVNEIVRRYQADEEDFRFNRLKHIPHLIPINNPNSSIYEENNGPQDYFLQVVKSCLDKLD